MTLPRWCGITARILFAEWLTAGDNQNCPCLIPTLSVDAFWGVYIQKTMITDLLVEVGSGGGK